jgi:polygalacturonase
MPNATLDMYQQLHHYLRPMMFTLSKVTNLLIDGPTFRNSPKFVINPKQITNLVIRNTTVYNPSWAQNGDGIDISASKT